jgi:hypothetical protein
MRGFLVGDDAGTWTEATYPGSPYQEVAARYTDASGVSAAETTWGSSTCAEALSFDSLDGAIHDLVLGELEIRKTEEVVSSDGHLLLVTMDVQNASAGDLSDVVIGYHADIDVDYDEHYIFNTINDVYDDGRYVSSTGAESGVSVGFGACSDDVTIGHTGSWPVSGATPTLTDEDGGVADTSMGIELNIGDLSVGDSTTVSFVIAVGQKMAASDDDTGLSDDDTGLVIDFPTE